MSDRSALIRVASTLPAGSDERRTLLALAQKLGMEHDSPEAMKSYLKDHPNADPKNHSVKKTEKGKGKKKSPQETKETIDKFDQLNGIFGRNGMSQEESDKFEEAAKKGADLDQLYDIVTDDKVLLEVAENPSRLKGETKKLWNYLMERGLNSEIEDLRESLK